MSFVNENKSSAPSYTNETKNTATFTTEEKTAQGFDGGLFDEAVFDGTITWTNENKS